MNLWLQDPRYGFRMLRKNLVLTLVILVGGVRFGGKQAEIAKRDSDSDSDGHIGRPIALGDIFHHGFAVRDSGEGNFFRQ